MTAVPPGNNCGHRCEISPLSSFVSGSGLPPPSGTRNKPDACCAKTMKPSSDQLPPANDRVSHNVMAAPPDTETFLSRPSAKNAIHCPSGEKNGLIAPSVPGSGEAFN